MRKLFIINGKIAGNSEISPSSVTQHRLPRSCRFSRENANEVTRFTKNLGHVTSHDLCMGRKPFVCHFLLSIPVEIYRLIWAVSDQKKDLRRQSSLSEVRYLSFTFILCFLVEKQRRFHGRFQRQSQRRRSATFFHSRKFWKLATGKCRLR